MSNATQTRIKNAAKKLATKYAGVTAQSDEVTEWAAELGQSFPGIRARVVQSYGEAEGASLFSEAMVDAVREVIAENSK